METQPVAIKWFLHLHCEQLQLTEYCSNINEQPNQHAAMKAKCNEKETELHMIFLPTCVLFPGMMQTQQLLAPTTLLREPAAPMACGQLNMAA